MRFRGAAHRRSRVCLTAAHGVRYARLMSTRQHWSRGLQWGACAWLGYVTLQSVRGALWPMAAVWITSCVLIAAGSRWARATVALGMLAQIAIGLHQAARLSDLPGVS